MSRLTPDAARRKTVGDGGSGVGWWWCQCDVPVCDYWMRKFEEEKPYVRSHGVCRNDKYEGMDRHFQWCVCAASKDKRMCCAARQVSENDEIEQKRQ